MQPPSLWTFRALLLRLWRDVPVRAWLHHRERQLSVVGRNRAAPLARPRRPARIATEPARVAPQGARLGLSLRLRSRRHQSRVRRGALELLDARTIRPGVSQRGGPLRL